MAEDYPCRPIDVTVRRLFCLWELTTLSCGGGGSTPSHFDRLRWWGVKGAVEAKCEGCERSRVAWWSWHGGREGLPGVSSQDGSLSRPLRTCQSDLCRESVWLFSRTTADTKKAILLDKRVKMTYHGTIKKRARWCHMKNDYEVKLYMSERRKGLSQKVAAARAGMSERTARKYEQAGAWPSALKRPHAWQTRSNPFEEDWRLPWPSNSNAIPPSSRPRCLLCSVNGILIAIVRRRIARCGGILPSGEPCMDQKKTSSLSKCILRENEHNLILPI